MRYEELKDLPPDLTVIHNSVVALPQLPNAISRPPDHGELVKESSIPIVVPNPLNPKLLSP